MHNVRTWIRIFNLGRRFYRLAAVVDICKEHLGTGRVGHRRCRPPELRCADRVVVDPLKILKVLQMSLTLDKTAGGVGPWALAGAVVSSAIARTAMQCVRRGRSGLGR